MNTTEVAKEPEQLELPLGNETKPETHLDSVLNPLNRGLLSRTIEELKEKFEPHPHNEKQTLAAKAINSAAYIFAEGLVRNLNHPEQTRDLIETILTVKRAAVARISENPHNYT